MDEPNLFELLNDEFFGDLLKPEPVELKSEPVVLKFVERHVFSSSSTLLVAKLSFPTVDPMPDGVDTVFSVLLPAVLMLDFFLALPGALNLI